MRGVGASGDRRIAWRCRHDLPRSRLGFSPWPCARAGDHDDQAHPTGRAPPEHRPHAAEKRRSRDESVRRVSWRLDWTGLDWTTNILDFCVSTGQPEPPAEYHGGTSSQSRRHNAGNDGCMTASAPTSVRCRPGRIWWHAATTAQADTAALRLSPPFARASRRVTRPASTSPSGRPRSAAGTPGRQ